MFSDPNREMQELEQQLLEAEKKEQKVDAFFRDLPEEFIPAEPSDAPAEPDIRNFYNDYGRADKYDTSSAGSDRTIRRLTILASIECAAIAAVALYWFFHFL